MKIQILLIIVAAILLQSCSTPFFDYYSNKKNEDCAKIETELKERYDLFSKIGKAEIKYRKKTKVKTVSKLDELSVVSEIVESLKMAKKNAKFVPVDLRFYKKIYLGNIIISNVEQRDLRSFMQNSKYAQGTFTLININSEAVTAIPPMFDKSFEVLTIKRRDLANAEIVLNVSDAKHISGNMKFSPNQKISIIADRVIDPYGLDLRESSNIQSLLNEKWIMSVYSVKGSNLEHGKDTTGFFRFVNNYNATINIDKFKNSSSGCYLKKNGQKFKY